MKIAITVHGIPNHYSEGTTKEALLLAEELINRKLKFKFFIQNYSVNFASPVSKKKLLKNIKKFDYFICETKPRNLAKKIIYFFVRLFTFNPDYFFTEKKTRLILEKKILSYNPDIIINMLNMPISSCYKIKNIPQYNYINMPPHHIEYLRLKNFFKDFQIRNIFKMVNSFFFIFTIPKVYKKLFQNTEIGFLASPDSYDYYRKIFPRMKLIKLKNITKNLNNKYIENKNRKKTFVMIGNLRATFTLEGLYELYENLLPKLKDIQKKYGFKINIIGNFSPPTSILKQEIHWINYTGWVKNLNPHYKNSMAILVTNPSPLGTRIRILNAMQVGLPVITYVSNIKNNPEFIDGVNCLIAKNPNEFVKKIEQILKDPKILNFISKNANKTGMKEYNYKKIINYFLNQILKNYNDMRY